MDWLEEFVLVAGPEPGQFSEGAAAQQVAALVHVAVDVLPGVADQRRRGRDVAQAVGGCLFAVGIEGIEVANGQGVLPEGRPSDLVGGLEHELLPHRGLQLLQKGVRHT